MRHGAVALACALVVVTGPALSACSAASADSGSTASTTTPPTTGQSAAPTSAATTATPTATHSGPWSVVALGDSVPSGGGCDCTPYPERSATTLLSVDGEKWVATNDAVGGYTTSDVLEQLATKPDVAAHVADADVVEIEIGANDVGYDSSCGPSVGCYQPTIPTVQRNLDQIVSKVHELTKGRTVLVVLLDYWSVWLGGQYAEAQGDAYVEGAAAVTDNVNAVIKDTATRTGASYVDLRAAFKGPDYTYDETHYLAPDGDHPNAAGHQQIADALVGVVNEVLRP